MINDNSNDKTFIFDSFFRKFLLSYFLYFFKNKIKHNIFLVFVNNLKIMMKSEIYVFKKIFSKLITINLFLLFL